MFSAPRVCVIALFFAFTPSWLAVEVGKPAQADDDLSKTALSIAPQDAAFFSTSVNMREGWRDFVESDFVSRLRGVPFVQELEAEFLEQWDDPQGQLAQAKGILESPNVQALIRLGEDMFRDEMFVYGGDDWCEMIEGMLAFQNRMTSAMGSGPEAMEEFFGSLERTDVERIRIPTTVMGFRLSEDDNARLQLDALEGILRLGGSQIEQAQPLLRNLRRADLKDGQTLTLKLDTSLIPLEVLDEEQRAVAEKVIELLEGRSVSIALGVKSNILLMAFGEGESVLDTVGEDAHKLLNHEAFSVLREAAPANLRSIAYASQRWRESQWNANFGTYFQNLTNQFSVALNSEADRIPDLEAWQNELATDAQWLDDRIQDLAPRFGPVVSWAAATDSGSEGYSYDWSENISFENATPFSITEHAGKRPLLLFSFKQKEVPAAEEILAYVLDKAPRHVRRFVALAERNEEEREQALKIFEQAWPLVEEAFAIFRDKIGPALADNEHLISVSADWSTSQLNPGVPPPRQALPLPEIATACKLADRDQFLRGCEEIYQLLDRVVEITREHDPEAVPIGYTVPRPQEDAMASGTRYFYSEFSAQVPIPGFEPQLVVGQDVLVLGYSDRQVRDMFQPKPLETRPAWMDADTPAAGLSYVDFAGLVTAVRPWIEYGLMVSGRGLNEPLANQPGPVPTGNDVLQIWDCFKSAGKMAATVMVNEDGPTVTRWVWVGE